MAEAQFPRGESHMGAAIGFIIPGAIWSILTSRSTGPEEAWRELGERVEHVTGQVMASSNTRAIDSLYGAVFVPDLWVGRPTGCRRAIVTSDMYLAMRRKIVFLSSDRAVVQDMMP